MKVAIVGTAPSTVLEAPYQDESWQIWSLGANYDAIPRWSRWFELHHKNVLDAAHANPTLYDFMREHGDKVVVGHPNSLFPDAKLYPIHDIAQKFGKYFNSSISYMIAMAIDEGATEIGMWGVDMLGENEYAYQRACCEYLLGVARGKGITITLPDKCPLLRCERMYAFEYDQLSAEMLQMEDELNAQVKAAEAAKAKAERDINFYSGQKAMHNNIQNRWG